MGAEAIKRYQKLHVAVKPTTASKDSKDNSNGFTNLTVEEVRKTRGGVILDPDDCIKHVLDDNEFVNIGKYLKIPKSVEQLFNKWCSKGTNEKLVNLHTFVVDFVVQIF